MSAECKIMPAERWSILTVDHKLKLRWAEDLFDTGGILMVLGHDMTQSIT